MTASATFFEEKSEPKEKRPLQIKIRLGDEVQPVIKRIKVEKEGDDDDDGGDEKDCSTTFSNLKC